VLTGIFFYMGVVSLLGQQFVQRIGLLFMPVKYQPDYAWLRSVPIKRVHTFTWQANNEGMGLNKCKIRLQHPTVEHCRPVGHEVLVQHTVNDVPNDGGFL